MKKKVMLVNYTGRSGGGALDAYEMTKALVEQGIEVVAVVSEYVENLEQWNKLNLVKLIKIKTYNSYISYLYRTIQFFLFERFSLKKQLDNFDITYVYVPMIAQWTDIINSCCSYAKVVTVIHDPIPHSGHEIIAKFSPKACVNKAYKIILHSEKFIEYVENKYYKKGNVHYVPLGRHDLYNNLEAANPIVSYDADKINFLFFGAISKYKGLNVLAQAYEIVSSQMNNATLTIIGKGDFSEYKAMYDTLPNVNVINRWIEDDEVVGLFKGENIITVLPYIDATQSGVVLVSMENNCPVIATNTGGLSEQINHEVTGILVEPNDAKSLANGMLELARNAEKREELIAGAKVYLETIKWENLAIKLIDILE